MKLVIVESKNKIKTIKKFLGNDFEVIATGGHIRELVKNGTGYDKTTYNPIWQNIDRNNKINEIKNFATKAQKVYLATDPDREGEAISWHLQDILTDKQKLKCKRITFNEITEKAILNAMENERDIDLNLVYSQWARRLLDRLVGFSLSRLVKSKLRATSAGRVQSVALLFVVERAKEVLSFVPDYWWTIDGQIKDKDKLIDVFLRKISINDIEPFDPSPNTDEYKFKSEEDALKVQKLLSNKYKIYKIDEPHIKTGRKYEPFETDSLLRHAINQLGWNSSKTTTVANVLYSGVKLDGEQKSLISYPRTDSNRLNHDFIATIRNYISKNFGDEYVNPNVKNAKSNPLIQGAHEGIRPIDIELTPDILYKKIGNDANANDIYKLYSLIWTRTVSAFMMPSKIRTTNIRFLNNNERFYTTYSKLIFDGYYKLPTWKKVFKYTDLSHLKVGDVLFQENQTTITQHETKSRGFLNEGSLIKELKDSGVGRPSTYSSMVNVVRKRAYVEPNKKELTPTELGYRLIENLTKEFNNYISKNYTAQMESDLDKIADGNEEWKDWFLNFEKKYNEQYEKAKLNMKKVPYEKVNRKCPKCNGELVYKENSRDHSKFIGCENFELKKPDQCTYTESLDNKPKKQPTMLEEDCPWCDSKLLLRQNKKNESFVACSGFPKCKYTRSSIDKSSELPQPKLLDERCPKCKHQLVSKYSAKKKKTFIGCSNFPKCRYAPKNQNENK